MTNLENTSSANDARSQADYYAAAEADLPGAGLGGYALPDDVRFVIKRGEGSRVESVDGRWYIDYVGGAGANILGHCHPAVVEAIREQAGRGLHYFGTLNDLAIELTEELIGIIPCADKLAISTTGSEATFYAMRMARAFTGRDKILKFEGAYHGNHDYSNFASYPSKPANYPVAKADSGGIPGVLQPMVLVAPYNDLEAAGQIAGEHQDDLAAIIVEPLQRIVSAKPEFLSGLRELADETGAVLIFDEVVTGFRIALGGAQEVYGVIPDLATYGKIVGGGGPLSAVAGRADIVERANPKHKGAEDYAFMNGTLHGNPLAAAAGLATLRVLREPGFYEALFARSDALLAALQDVLDRHGLPALAAGRLSFWQFLFLTEEPESPIDIMRSDTAAMRKLDLEMLRRGVYVLPGVRRFVSAVNTEDDFEITVDALDAACRTL